jgi:hypothetical protein
MEENSCAFVSSRGITKSFIYRNPDFAYDGVVRFTVREPLNGSLLTGSGKPKVIYITTATISDFVKRILPRLIGRFVLVTGDSDRAVPTDCMDDARILLQHRKLVAWFSQNCVGGHPKLHQIPIGLDYHTLTTEYRHGWGDMISSVDQEKMLIGIADSAQKLSDRLIKCYSNFHINTYYGNVPPERKEAINEISPDVIDYQQGMLHREDTWTQMAKYAFIPSPKGGGHDCHRTWEALALGCIPILKTSALDPMFEGLPVWIVQNWSEITQESMQKKVEEYTKTTPNYSKLYLGYWIKKIIDLN